MEQNDNRSQEVGQRQEADATDSQARMVASQIMLALDVPFNARWEDQQARIDLTEARVAYVKGYVGEALESGNLSSIESLAEVVVRQFPVSYEAAKVGAR
jgi:hypothetical protein